MASAGKTTPAPTGAFAVTVVPDYTAMGLLAADIVMDAIAARPDAAITLPTGGTPRGMYEELVRRIRVGTLDVSRLRFFCLDDYLGQSMTDEASLTGWLDRTFLTPAGLPREHIHLIPTGAADPDEAARRYEAEIAAAGGLEIAVVGLGPNGHVGFNEPGSTVDSRTRVVSLTEASRKQNAAYYEGEPAIPDRAITMGIGTILDARRIVMIVSGESKATTLKEALDGPIGPELPASFLRLAGDRLRVIADRDAASALA